MASIISPSTSVSFTRFIPPISISSLFQHFSYRGKFHSEMCEPTSPMDQHEQPKVELPLVSGQNSEDVNPPKLLVISRSSTQMLGDTERRGIYDAGDDACSLAGKDKPRSLSPPFFGIHDCKRETEVQYCMTDNNLSLYVKKSHSSSMGSSTPGNTCQPSSQASCRILT